MSSESRTSSASPVLASQSVVVTGASGDIGSAIAVAAARAGAVRVALLGRSEARLDATARAVEKAGSEALARVCDVSDIPALMRAIESIDPIDVLVNCAGANVPQGFLDVTEETFDTLWHVNVRAAFFASQAAARKMVRDRRSGVIVNISSQMGHVGAARRTVYCTTKHALEGLTKALAVELAPDGIRVVSVAPTFVRTSMTASQLDDPRTSAALLSEIPLGRFEEARDVAAAVVFAASADAPFLTGSSLKVDGGWTAK